MSKELINDWLKFCDGTKDYDPSHFYTLFMEEVPTSDIKRIFSNFPHGEELIKRLNRLKNNTMQEEMDDPQDRKERSIELVLNDFKEKRRVCSILNEDELVKILENNTVEFVDDEEFYNLKDEDNAWPTNEVMMLVGRYLRDSMGNYDKKISALMEASYGIINDYNIVWYIINPFIKDKYNSDYYIRLWELGAEYFISDKKIYILMYDL